MMKNRLFLTVLAALALASCSNDDLTVAAPDNTPDAISFRTLTTSRATETTLSTLVDNGFYVTALNSTDDPFFRKLKFVQGTGEESNSWVTAAGQTTYTWPHNRLYFYAYAPSELTLNIQTTQPMISGGYSPAAAPESQEDLVYATQSAIRSDFSKDVPLTFKHALAQIKIIAINGNTTRSVKVKGVRIGHVNTKGDFTFPEPLTKEQLEAGTDIPDGVWSNQGTVDKYTTALFADDKIVTLESQSQTVLGTSFMVIPQAMQKWFPDADVSKGEVKEGAYLALLVQITNIDSSSDQNGKVMYPACTYATTGQYGWAAVPIEANWVAGNCYTYVLDFTNGAGKVAPDKETPTDDTKDNDTDNEDGDPFQEGDDIIGHNITFSVTVKPWVTDGLTTTTSMNQAIGTN